MRPKPLERHVWKRLARDTRGVAAIEFAFLAPVLIVMYFAMVEYCQAYMALKRTDHVAAMVADLTSQNDKFVKSQIEDVFAIGDVIMAPFATTTLTQRVSSVTRVNATTYRVDWSIGKGIASKLTVAEAKVPDDMLAQGVGHHRRGQLRLRLALRSDRARRHALQAHGLSSSPHDRFDRLFRLLG